jgi:heme exporter protein A
MARLHLSRNCPLWLLDEPLTALDVDGVAALAGLLDEHVHDSGIVVMTSHQSIELASVNTLHIQLPS